MNVTARLGHHPITPGGFPFTSLSLQYSRRSSAAWRMPFVVTSKAPAVPPAALIQLTMRWRWASWLYSRESYWYASVSQYSLCE